ncbi:MAG: type IV secretory system conjugative DNA transfer family protein [Bacteroidetes bacterium]|nr:type IV secretory system conjugative DNA transfer family protein [Bacteroidota bacterium]
MKTPQSDDSLFLYSIEGVVFMFLAIVWFAICLLGFFDFTVQTSSLWRMLFISFFFLLLLLLGIWCVRNVLRFINYVFAVHPIIQSNLHRAFYTWGVSVCVLYLVVTGGHTLKKAYRLHGKATVAYVGSCVENPENIYHGASYVVVHYVGAVLRQLYNMLRSLSAVVAQDFINQTAQTEPSIYSTGDKIRQYRNAGTNWWGRTKNWFLDITADATDALTGTSAVRAAISAKTQITQQYGEIIAMAFVTGALYKFWGFFVWLYNATVLMVVNGFLFFFGSTSLVSKSFFGKGSGTLGLVLNGLLILVGLRREKDIAYGSAEFADRAWKKQILHKRHTGLVVDGNNRISSDLSYKHVAVIAPSGMGKTSSYVMPNLLATDANTAVSYVVTDPKGEMYEQCAEHLRKMGYNIVVFDVNNAAYNTYNPLKRAESDEDINKVAQILVNATLEGGSGDRFWNDNAMMLLVMLIRVLKNYGRIKGTADYYNLHNLRHLLNNLGENGYELVSFVNEYAPDAELIDEYRAFCMQSERVFSSTVATARTALKDVAIQETKRLTASDTISFEQLRTEKTVLFVVVPPSDVQYYRFLLTLLYSQLFSFCERSEGLPLYFLLDEFGNLGKIPSFDKLITTLRSKQCSISLILQDMAQLETVYGKQGASTIINGGCNSKLIFGGVQNLETLTIISKLMGEKTIDRPEKDDTGAKIGRLLMTPDEIRRMAENEVLFLSTNLPPLQAEVVPYFENERFSVTPIERKPSNTPAAVQFIDLLPYKTALLGEGES